ncbi:hypothetical protein [Ferroplasma acidiphilum]|jgi:hypothetical protein|uniref:hypothetical protein n=1 Tax=Ferroplasma acidiphilum TaxID=74969 RepID=UPI002814A9BB|nr:hypothetical protein [Ferroplasma acidiphilum]WMT53777.1 MAG: hypothetical protein RE473_02760 [Ferroplasma acidiphilum]
MEKKDIEKILNNLSKERPIFHGERDFQFSLGCEIKSKYPNMKIILEKTMKGNNNTTERIDIGIELKFIKGKFSGEVDGDEYHWLGNEAYDLKSYDTLKDIQRLEHYIQYGCIDFGYSIVLSNARLLWEQQCNDSHYDQFSLYEGRMLPTTLSWPSTTIAGKKGEKRKDSITLCHEYSIHWKKYPGNVLGIESNNPFKYLIFEIDKCNNEL